MDTLLEMLAWDSMGSNQVISLILADWIVDTSKILTRWLLTCSWAQRQRSLP